MNKNLYLVIMAGGVGSRFWPLSRESRPKQFLDILGVGKSFLRQTYERFSGIVPAENILVVTGEAYRGLVAEQIPELAEEQILGEPLGRNTAPCIAYAAFRLKATAPDSVMIVTPADHLITGEREFERAILDGVEFARGHDAIVTIGITPTRPDTGYGYIQAGKPFEGGVAKVKTFTEKPSEDVARRFVESGEFFWNSGLFIWKTDTILNALSRHLGEIYTPFTAVEGSFGTSAERDVVRRIYPQTRNISIDFGVIEKADNVYVRRSDFGWSDVGTWNSLYGLSPKDERGNAVYDGASGVAPHATSGSSGPASGGRPSAGVRLGDTTGSLIRIPDGKLAVIEGLEDYVVVDTPDVLLVWPRSREQQIKQVVTTLKFDGGDGFL